VKRARWVLLVAGVAALVALFVLLRPEGARTPSGSSSPTPTGTPTATPGTTPSPTSTDEPGDALEVEVEIEEGRIEVEVEGRRSEGPVTVPVTQGARVALEVESDVQDEVHLHGYNLFADVAPSSRGTLTFRADVAGVFEIELERAGALLARLEVAP